MTQREISEHAGYLIDGEKLASYEAALRSVLSAGSAVLDLGAGTGILGLLAARLGARHVYAVDRGSIIGTAQDIAVASGLADRMTFLRRASTEVDLPERVDIVVCDQVGGMAYDAGVLLFLADARRRLLVAGGTLVPRSFKLLTAPVESRTWPDRVGIWARKPAGFDMTPMFELAVNTEFRVDLAPAEFLGEPMQWAEIEADRLAPVIGGAEVIIERPGVINGVVGMFLATLAPGVEIGNCPLLPSPIKRWQNLYPLPAPVPVAPGDRVEIRFDLRPSTHVATWSVSVHTSKQPAPVVSRGSTVLGRFLTPADLATAAGRAVPRPSIDLAVDQFILDQVDGERSLSTIADLAWAAHGETAGTRDALKHRVEHLLRHHLPV